MQRLFAFDCLRIIIGVVLFFAASAKAIEIATSDMGSDPGIWSKVALVTGELVWGSWLLSGVGAKVIRLVSIIVFIAFCFVSFHSAILGRDNCHCFGQLNVNPWYSLSIDVVCVACLLVISPVVTQTIPPMEQVRRRSISKVVCISVASSVGVLFVALAAAQWNLERGSAIILSPDDWNGKTFPIVDSVDIDGRFADGKWYIVLYHFDCHKCRDLITECTRRAERSSAELWAFVSLPPHENSSLLPHESNKFTANIHWGKLSDSHDYFIPSPTIVVLKDGIVVNHSVQPTNFAELFDDL